MMYHTKTAHDVIKSLHTNSDTGLTNTDFQIRQKDFGLNQLEASKKTSPFIKFLNQFKNFLVLLLMGATIISLFLGEFIDAVAILVIILLNATLGFIQEHKAEKALDALKNLSTQYCRVIRSGEVHKIETKNLVPGDIVLLEAGDKVPADCRVLETIHLEISEAIITGESVPVKKFIEPIDNPDIPLGDKKNLLFKDTIVTTGRGKAVVYAIGMDTEIGKISQLLKEDEEEQTPLQEDLDKVGKKLSLIALCLIAIVFIVAIASSLYTFKHAFLTAVSLAVAAIPEGLPAVVTIVLAIGVTRLAKQNAIIRKLPAVETLGSTTYILTDKTGTLTQNRMVVTNIITNEKEYEVDGTGYIPTGNFYIKQQAHNQKINPTDAGNEKLIEILKAGALCNNAELNKNAEKNKWEIVGDITEGALIVAAQKADLDYRKLKEQYTRLDEVPFDSDNKYMVTMHRINKDILIIVKGAPEKVLDFCKIDFDSKGNVLNKIETLASNGLRSLGIASKTITNHEYETYIAQHKNIKDLYKDLSFLGIIAQKDPIRPEVKEAIYQARIAGITTVMVTGDHKLTATSIGRELGIINTANEAISGEELDKIGNSNFSELVKTIRIFARVSPEQKLKIAKALKDYGQIIAVTGDGVNDAPAIKAADIGVAMGIEGTDVTKEVADMVLQDDNYKTIVAAIQEGRIVFDNLVKAITYLISCNISEIVIVFIAVLYKLPTPLLPIHLLWINLITDGFPALALGMEPGEKDIMKRSPRATNEGLLNKSRWVFMVCEGVFMGIVCFYIFNKTLEEYGIEVARTITFLGLSLMQLCHALNKRSEKSSILKTGIFGNKILSAVFFISIAIQIPVLYTTVGEHIFEAAYLNINQLKLVVYMGLSQIIFVEILKFIKRKNT